MLARLSSGFAPHGVVRAHQVAKRLRSLRKLDQHDADVVDHREQHLAKILGLQRGIVSATGVGMRTNRIHSRDAADQRRDVGAESRLNVVGVESVDRRETAEQRRDDRIGIEMQRRDDRGCAYCAVEHCFAVGQSLVIATIAREVKRGLERLAHGRVIRRRERLEPRRNRLRRGSARRGVQHGNHARIIRRVGAVQPPARSSRMRSAARNANAAIVNVGGDDVIVGKAADPTMNRLR